MKQTKIKTIQFANPPRPRELKNLRKLGVPRSQKDWEVGYIRDPGKTDDFCDFWVQAVTESPVGTAVNKRLTDFIGGKGFVNANLKDKMVNEQDTAMDLHEKIVQDFALWGRFAVRVVQDKGRRGWSIKHIPVEWVRYEWGDEHNGYMEDIKACYVLPMINSSEMKQMQLQRLPLWNGKDDLGKDKSIEFGKTKEGGRAWKLKGESEWCDYKGHIFFFNPPHPSNRIYSRPDLYSAERDILADGRVGEFFERLTANQFLPGGVLTVFGDPQERIREYGDGTDDRFDTAEDVLNEQLSEHFSGTTNAGSLIVLWAENEGEVPNIQPFQVGNLHEMFLSANSVIRGRIAMAAQIPEVLLGVQTSGSLGQNNELVTAIGFANESTKKKRTKLEEAYKMLFKGVKGIKTTNIEIQPIQNFGDLPQYIFTAMTAKQKEEHMSKVYDIEPDPEGRMVPDEIIEVEETGNETIEEDGNSDN